MIYSTTSRFSFFPNFQSHHPPRVITTKERIFCRQMLRTVVDQQKIIQVLHKAMRSKSFNETSTKRSFFTRSTSEKTTTTTGTSPDDPSKASVSQCSVVSIYHVVVAGTTCTATVTWSATRINHSLTVSFERPGENDVAYTFKIELKQWPFWGKKGLKTLDVGSRRVDVFWDFRSAKFANGPEPLGGFYVAFVCYGEVILCIGDCKKDAYRRTRCRPSLVDAVLLSKRQNVFGKKCFSARARFDERKREHDIVVENSITGPQDPEMWISIDGIVLIHVSNLQWKFRGNDTVVVETMPVQVFWDVHNWLFGTPDNGEGFFVFKPGAPVREDEPEEDGKTAKVVGSSEFCFFLCASKLE